MLQRLAEQCYRADPRKQELRRLAAKRRSERTKHLRKFRRSDKEPEKKIRIEASSQHIDREPSSEPIACAFPTHGEILEAPLDKAASAAR